MSNIVESTSLTTELSKVYSFESFNETNERLLKKYRQLKKKINFDIIEETLSNKSIFVKENYSSGPNSLIYVGQHPEKEKKVSIKVILKNFLRDMNGSLVKRHLAYEKIFMDSRLGRVYEILTLNTDLFCIVTDFYEKGSLAKLLIESNGPLQESSIQTTFVNVLQGLYYLHTNKIAHRNLKLENIFFDDDLKPVIADYSHSIIIENLSNFDQLLCTSLPYLAPEITSKIPYDPIIADVWSYGVCLFAMLNNCFPFMYGEKLNPLYSTYHFKAEVENLLSDEVKSCFKETLQFDVNKRITSSSLLKMPWFQKQ